MAQSGQLGADAYVAGPGLNGWTPAAQVPQLSAPPVMAAAGGGAMPMAGQGMAPQPGYGQPMAPQPGYGQPMAAPGMAGAMGPAMGGVAPPGAQAMPPEPKSSWIKERLRGLAAVAIALLVLVANGISIFSSGYFYPKSLILGLGALGYGGWVLIFGDEYDDYTLELVRWKQIGMWGCAALGALIGIVLSVVIAE